jgi:cytochrome P450
VLNRFLAEDLDGRRLSDMEVASHLNMLVIGGTETLPKVFSKAVYRLFQHPDQRDRCIADPSLLPDAFQETLRYDMPTQMLGRSVLRDFELHGETVREGQGLMFLWASANRDEREFSDPDRFDIERRAPRILSFGHGTHTCLGAHVARMEGRVLLEELLARIPDYTVDEERIEHLSSEFFRGFLSLPISFERR